LVLIHCNSASRGTRTVLPFGGGMRTTGIVPRCISLYAMAREQPITSATSLPRSNCSFKTALLIESTMPLALRCVQGVYYGLSMAINLDLANYTDPTGKLGKTIPPGRIYIPHQIWLEDGFLRWNLARMDPMDTSEMRSYVPPKSLLNDFARLWQLPEQKILDFAKRYGVLDEKRIEDRIDEYGIQGREPLERWRLISRSVLAILTVGAELAVGKNRITRDEWKWMMGPRYEFRNESEEQYLNRLEKPAQARGHLYVHLHPWMDQVGLGLKLKYARGIELEVEYRGGMLSAVGLQLGLTIANSDRLFICSGCGLPYCRSADKRRPKTGQSNFCDECGKAAALRQADGRRKEKMTEARRLHASNVSVNEIAKRLDTTPASVRRWVKKGR
jgi:hypothetical protein